MLLLRSILYWLLILCLAVANGALREAVLIPSLGKSYGLVLSGLLLSLFVAVVAYAFVRRMHVPPSQAMRVGTLWLFLTLVFEFGFGRLVQHKAWSELLDAYTFKEGNIWPVVLLATLVAPYVAARIHGRSAGA